MHGRSGFLRTRLFVELFLKEKIQKIYDDSHQNYGAPKIAAELRKSGEPITEKQ